MSPKALEVLPSRYGSPAPQVWSGPVLDRIAEYVAPIGTHVALISDDVVGSTPSYHRVRLALRDADVVFTELKSSLSGPSDATCAPVAAALAECGADVIVAMGGGSVIDTAKASAMLLANGGRLADWRGYGATTQPGLPIVAVPTTAGTGSEVQSFAVVDGDGAGTKMACGSASTMPRVALLDPRALATLPPEVAAVSGMDALVHTLETLVTTAGTPESRAVAKRAFSLVWQGLRVITRPTESIGMEAAYMVAQTSAMMAGSAIEASMLGAAHAAANPLTARFGVPHGVAVGAMIPHVVRLNRARPEADAAYQLLEAEIPAKDLAAALTLMAEEIGLETDLVGSWGVTVDAVPALARDAAQQWTGTFNPVPVDAAAFEGLYRAALEPR